MKIEWRPTALSSLAEEIDYILIKWPAEEAVKFYDLVERTLILLENQPYLGKFDSRSAYYFLVISKQTTLTYQVDESADIIYLHLFWNNQRNPDQLLNLLRS